MSAFAHLRILCPLALMGVAVHYMLYHVPHLFEGKIQTSLLRGLQALNEGPRQSRRLVDEPTLRCSCPCKVAVEDGAEQEGWMMVSLDEDLITTLAGDPLVCMPKDESVTMLKLGLGACEVSCLS